ncbi:MAG: hypothetical protein ACLGIK_14120, partial [Gemmatimonadota bacterium]
MRPRTELLVAAGTVAALLAVLTRRALLPGGTLFAGGAALFAGLAVFAGGAALFAGLAVLAGAALLALAAATLAAVLAARGAL